MESFTGEPEPYSMLDWPVVERTRIADGTELVLSRYADDWCIRVGPQVLMASRMHDSEEVLASLALERAPSARAVLVGGLGLGYTARAVLDHVRADAEVTVVELVPEVVDWNRTHLGHLANHPLIDGRCHVIVADVLDTLTQSPSSFDVILLDVDNGPKKLTQARNQRLYGDWGIRACLAALRPGGVLAAWSRGPDARYRRGLERHASHVEVLPVVADARWDLKHVVFMARTPRR